MSTQPENNNKRHFSASPTTVGASAPHGLTERVFRGVRYHDSGIWAFPEPGGGVGIELEQDSEYYSVQLKQEDAVAFAQQVQRAVETLRLQDKAWGMHAPSAPPKRTETKPYRPVDAVVPVNLPHVHLTRDSPSAAFRSEGTWRGVHWGIRCAPLPAGGAVVTVTMLREGEAYTLANLTVHTHSDSASIVAEAQAISAALLWSHLRALHL